MPLRPLLFASLVGVCVTPAVVHAQSAPSTSPPAPVAAPPSASPTAPPPAPSAAPDASAPAAAPPGNDSAAPPAPPSPTPAAPAPAPAPHVVLVEPPPPPVPAPDPTAYRHDGLYLRLGLGGGYVFSDVDSPLGDLSGRGGGVSLEIALGGTVADGLVLGGGIYTVTANRVHWRGDSLRDFSSSGASHVTGNQGSVGLLGVFVDYYPDPKGGLHVQGALGIGTLSYDDDHSTRIPPETWAGGGGGAMLGVGYEWWVGRQWSVGGVARVLGVSAAMRGDRSDVNFDGRALAPSILFVATHH